MYFTRFGSRSKLNIFIHSLWRKKAPANIGWGSIHTLFNYLLKTKTNSDHKIVSVILSFKTIKIRVFSP